MNRKLVVTGLCVLAGALLLCAEAPTTEKGKKDDPKKQIQELKKTIADRDQKIVKLEGQLTTLKFSIAQQKDKVVELQKRVKELEAAKKTPGDKGLAKLKKDLATANQTIKDKDDVIATLQKNDLSKEVVALRKKNRELESLKKAPLVHTKILKLKKIDDAQVKSIYDEANKTLAKIDGVRGVWIGKPADNGASDPSSRGFQIGVVVLLDDALALQRFLDDPLHKQFADKMANHSERPVVYDIQREVEEPKKD